MGAIFAQEILEHREARGAPALDRRGAREGQPAHARGARAARRQRPRLRAATPRAATCCDGAADVVVCDGFTGNVALKLLEGTIATLLDALRDEITATPRGQLGGLLIRPAARRLRTRLDPDTYGGAYLLGLRGLVGDRARQLVASGDRERDPARGPRRRARRRRPARGAPARARQRRARRPRSRESSAPRYMIGALLPNQPHQSGNPRE